MLQTRGPSLRIIERVRKKPLSKGIHDHHYEGTSPQIDKKDQKLRGAGSSRPNGAPTSKEKVSPKKSADWSQISERHESSFSDGEILRAP